ncbi:pyridoxal phosphate-dependent aminotransferase family protein [Kribbella antibiotica]|uniref:8-amino-7-oxononanoate synthase n=1 Tax=Kribbella antibiotica TaxID=190195 RepID=A0A4R4ZTC3_9ACTN|nr:pyridoxal phosphate-dependent aminotransferase family protein [Kribbella antibiotica]TDD61690.1 pyridoxal phosphate-dependent aminotransferase family protein [Kribbella antibiotica]
MSIFDKAYAFDAAELARRANTYPYYPQLDHPEGATVVFEERRRLNIGSNNYLGLATDRRVKQAAIDAVNRFGTSVSGARVGLGNTPLHDELEAELADFLNMPAALVFGNGFDTNLGVIVTLCGPGDYVVLDELAHRSIVDAAKFSGAELRRFKHNDVAALRAKLEACPRDADKLVVVDGVYSMDGDLAPLPDIIEICRLDPRVKLMVDDAHGAGVFADGRGTAAHLGVADEVDLLMVTFSKSFASRGGAILAEASVVDYLKHTAAAMLFTVALSPADTAAALAALRIVRAEPWLCQSVLATSSRVREGLFDLGFAVGGESPIVPVLTGDQSTTVSAYWELLRHHDILAGIIAPPAASYRLRTSYSAANSAADVERVVEAFGGLGQRFPHLRAKR